MANRFLSNITINDSYTFPSADGASGQVISTDGAGNLSFVDQTATEALTLNVTVKNVSGGSLAKGTIVHASPSATPPSGNVVEIIAADYDTSTSMPAIGVLNETLANEAEGKAVMFGAVSGIDTSSFSAGDELWVGNNGAFTNTKPATAGQLIQKIAVVIKSHASNGLIKIFGAGRTNDVPLPLYIDDTNQRVGVGTSSPTATLELNSATSNQAVLKISRSTNPAITNNLQLGTSGGNSTITAIGTSSVNPALIFQIGTTSVTTESMRIDSSGNVGIGTGTISATYSPKLQVESSATDGTGGVLIGSYLPTLTFQDYSGGSTVGQIQQDGTGLVFKNNGLERMRITSGGDVNFGGAFTAGSNKVNIGSSTNQGYIQTSVNLTSSLEHLYFYNPNGVVGSISTSGSSTSFNTSSDYRLKENVVPMEGALDRVDTLKPSRFNFIADPSTTVDGFLAHEVAEVIPEAISGEKDAVEEYEVTPAVLDEEGNVIEEAVMGTRPVYQGIDQSKIVPLLVGAIQELKAEIESLKSQING